MNVYIYNDLVEFGKDFNCFLRMEMSMGGVVVGKRRSWRKEDICIGFGDGYQKYIHLRNVRPITYTATVDMHYFSYSTEVDIKKIIGWWEK